MMPVRKKKGPSMAKVARTYKRNTKSDTDFSGARVFTDDAKSRAAGTTTRKTTYKPKPMSATFGVGGSIPGTKRVKRNKL